MGAADADSATLTGLLMASAQSPEVQEHVMRSLEIALTGSSRSLSPLGHGSTAVGMRRLRHRCYLRRALWSVSRGRLTVTSLPVIVR